MLKVESIERIKIVPCDDGWLERICGKVKACLQCDALSPHIMRVTIISLPCWEIILQHD